MSETDIVAIVFLVLGFAAGYNVGHGRGTICGIKRCTERLHKESP